MSISYSVDAKDTVVETAGVKLEGVLTVPDKAVGMVVFAHGSGSSRFSGRNLMVAKHLNDSGLATLLFDLLTQDENVVDEHTRQYRFDIPLLGRRLVGAVDWIKSQPELAHLKVGTFGASTGAAAALIADAERPREVGAVVSRGGRPDLAGEALPRVQAPTLFIVGGMDDVVIGLNHQAADALQCHYRLTIVPGATHLFAEPGKLEQVAHLARDWFVEYLSASR
jgi:putative phosphoribosyl transferase